MKPGDTVAKDDPLVELESDKATMEVPSPAAGTVTERHGQGRRPGVARARVILTLEGAEARRPLQPQRRRPQAGRSRARPRPRRGARPATSTPRSWCSAPARAATPPRSAPPTSA